MRFLFSALAAPGHTYPLIPLAVALQDAGHDVLFATSASVHPALTASRVRPVAAGMEVGEAFAQLPREGIEARGLAPDQIGPVTARVFADILPRSFTPDLVEVIGDFQPDAVIRELGNNGAAFAADRFDLPVIVHGFGLVLGAIGRVDETAYRAIAAELGVPEPRDPAEQYVVDVCPASLRQADASLPPLRLPMQPSSFRTPGMSEDLSWRADRPLIYLTLGTAFGSVPLLRQTIDGLSRLPVDLLVATGPSVAVTDLGDLPANVHAEAWVQQADVLPEAALVVHHGGSGTTLGACAAGIRQLLLPQGADQFFNADALVAAGTALQLVGDELTPDALVTAASELMTTDSYADAATRLASEIAAMPTPDTVAAQLPTLIP